MLSNVRTLRILKCMVHSVSRCPFFCDVLGIVFKQAYPCLGGVCGLSKRHKAWIGLRIPPLPRVLEPETFPATCPPASPLTGALLLLRKTYPFILLCFVVLGIQISGHQTKGQLELLAWGTILIIKSPYTCLGSLSFSILYKLCF